MAKESLDECDGIIEKAREKMVERVKRDPSLYRGLFDAMVWTACDNVIRHCTRAQRKQIWDNANRPDEEGARATAAAAEGMRNILFDMMLRSGRKLGDVTREELLEESEFYFAQGRNMLAKGSFYKLIAKKISEGKTVRQCISLQQANKIHRKVFGNEQA
ncbi:MAG TPA: hypothetical protein VKT73_12820 [Xanthobacteraceae bacterium]|nr:hypothetical protein [Xanthobacteraceae bacterium]